MAADAAPTDDLDVLEMTNAEERRVLGERIAAEGDYLRELQEAAVEATEREIEAERAALLAKRDSILQSLRDQFATKIDAVEFRVVDQYGDSDDRLDAFLLDLANNIAQALVGDES